MVNFRQAVRGYLFQGRFFSCPLDEKWDISGDIIPISLANPIMIYNDIP
jgi:hypothetical protein